MRFTSTSPLTTLSAEPTTQKSINKRGEFIIFDILKPTIKNTLSYKENNFTFIVYAHRKLTQNEIIFELKKYLRHKKLKSIPKNATIKEYSYGYESQDFL